MKTAQWVGRGLPLILAAMIGLVVWMNARQQEPSPPITAGCPDLVAGCTVMAGGRDIRLGTDQAIKPLKPFSLRVEAKGAARVEARFTMEGMDMGFNVYPLRADRQGVFRTTATLPVCVTGRRDWIMTLDVDGTRIAVPFVTEL